MGFLGIGGGPTLNTSATTPYTSALGTLAGQAQTGYNAANSQFGTLNTDYTKALNAYSNYLTTNPATQQYNAEQRANAEAGAREGEQNAEANTDQALARRGISIKSGIGAGALANLNEGLAANDANIENRIGQANIDQHSANLATNAGLLSGAANNAFGQSNTLEGQAENLNNTLYGDAYNTALQDYNGQLQQEAEQAQLVGAVGGFLGGPAFAAGGVFGKTAKKAV